MVTETLTGSMRSRGLCRSGEPADRLAVLAVAHELDADRLLRALGAAQRADQLALVEVDALAGERGAAAGGAAGAVARERPEALDEKLVLQGGGGTRHGGDIRHLQDRSFRKNGPRILVKLAAYVRIRTNSRKRPGGALEGERGWNH